MSAQAALAATETIELWSVTTLLKTAIGAGQGLINWNCEQTAIAALDQRDVVDQMLRVKPRDEVVKYLVKERWNATERARVRGTNVHAWAEAIALGKPPPELEPQEIPYGEQLARWIERVQPTYLMAEAPVYNLTHRYAGTCDGIVSLEGRRVLFDIKTTEKGPDARSRPPYKETALQIAAYAHAEEVGVLPERRHDKFNRRSYVYDPTAHREPMPQVDAALCVVVSPFDCFAVEVAIGDDVFRAFRAVLEVARFLESDGQFRQLTHDEGGTA